MALLLTETQVRDCRARIRAVAERRFAERGLAATSLRGIAADLGWAPASLYRYFDSKDALLSATRAAAHDRFSSRIECAYAQPRDLWERSRALGDAYVDFALEQPAAYQLIFAFEQVDADKSPELRVAEERSRRTLTVYVEDMVAADLLEGNPEILGHVYRSAIHGLIVLHMAGKLTRTLLFDTIHHEIVRLLTRGAAPVAASPPDVNEQRRRAASCERPHER